jgi:shikimate kinase
VIWLKASLDTIERRLATDPTTGPRRPNLTATGGREEIERLLAIREPIYRGCASLTVTTDDKPVDQLVAEIVRQLPANVRGDLP